MKPSNFALALSRNRGVAFLCVSIFAGSLGMGMIAPVLPLFVDQEFHVSRTQVGLAVGLFGVGRIFVSLPAGYLTQRLGRRFVLILGTAVNSLGAFMVAISFSYRWLVGWRMVSGIGSTMTTTAVSVFLSDVSRPENRARFLSLHELSILAAQSIGPVIGGFMGDHMGLRAPLYFQGLLMLVGMFVVVFGVPETRPWPVGSSLPAGRSTRSSGPGASGATPPGAYRRLLLNPGFILVGLLGMMIVANRQGGRFTVMPLYGEAKGFQPSQLGIFIAITHLPQFFTTLASGFIADRFGRKVTVVPAVVLISLGILLFIYTNSFPGLVISGVLLGLGEGLAGPPLVAYFADIAPPGLEGVTMGLFRTFGGAGSLLGAILLGGVADLLGFAWSLGIDAILLVATALGVMVVVHETAGRGIRNKQSIGTH
ncbi:MAG: hypothetical protein BZY80_03010 [SAR202 cluster bacterium Io17-Chloro-G2]|nr:MAG: hypothetical protein BZY80_03010 [SAR202 cluster bacterium Io17-Chloro-G2]